MTQFTAVSTSTFAASFGVNTHLDETWLSYANVGVVINALNYLGVSKVRDSMASPVDDTLFKYVAAATGVKFDAYLSLSEFTYAGEIAEMKSISSILVSVEGINEGDFSLPLETFGGQTGYAAIAAAQTALYQTFRYDPATSFISVIAPSYGDSANFANAVSTVAVSDYGNTHEYAGTGNPPNSGIPTFIAQAAMISDSLPDIATEAGYYSGSSLAGTIPQYQHSGVSELVQAKYDLDWLFDDWNAGIKTTYLYELLDETVDPGNTNRDNHFGLFNVDGSPKLAGYAIHNLDILLADSGSARTDTFGYQVVGAAGTGNSLLLERSNGVFELAIWNDIRLTDPTTGADLVNPLFPITIRFGQYVQSVTEYDPLTGTSAVLTWSNVNQISLNMPDHPVVLAITPYPASALSLQTFVLPETVAPSQSSGNLYSALIANATETNPSLLGGVTISSVQTSGTKGTVSFNAATHTLNYTAGSYTPVDPTDTFQYTLTDALGNAVTGSVAITEPLPANTLVDYIAGTRIDAPANGWTLQSVYAGQSLYGDSYTGLTFIGSTDTQMYGSTNSTFIGGNGNFSIGADSNARVTLGNGNNVIGLVGSGNVVVTGDGNNLLYKSVGNTTITMGNGNENITAGGQNNVITVGSGTSTIYVGADGNPDGNETVTVGGGANTITVGGAGDTVTVQGGNGNQVTAFSASATITLVAGASTVLAQGANSVINVQSGSNIVQTNGDGDTITLGSGGTLLTAGGSTNRITTGSGYASITITGQHDTIDATRGEVVLTERGSHNTIVLAAPGGIATQISGDTIGLSDTFDLRTALTATTWNGQSSTLANYLQIRLVGVQSVISIDADGTGPGTAADIAVLQNTANLTYAGLLAQAILPVITTPGVITPVVSVPTTGTEPGLAEIVVAGTPVNLWNSIVANAAWTNLNGTSGVTITAIGTAGTRGSVSFNAATRTTTYTPPAYSSANPTDSFTYSLIDALGRTETGTVTLTEAAPSSTLYDTAAGAALSAPAGNGWTLVSQAGGQTLSGSGSEITFVGGTDTSMYGGANATFIAGDGNHAIAAGNNATITLGNGNNTIGLTGSGNVVVTGNGNNTLSKSTGSTRISMGDGNQNITIGGYSSVLFLGVGNSTINMGTDGAPAGNDHLTVAGGANTITAVGADDVIHLLGGVGSTVSAQGGTTSITVDAGSTTVNVSKNSNFINFLSGSNTVRSSGDGDTITLGNGGTFAYANGNSDRITTGTGFAGITFLGHNDIIDARLGEVVLTELGSRNTIILAATGGIATKINGDVIGAPDTLDLRTALAATTWNGQQNTLSDYLQVSNSGSGSAIAIDADGRGPGSAVTIALLQNSPGLTYAGLLAHAVVI